MSNSLKPRDKNKQCSKNQNALLIKNTDNGLKQFLIGLMT